MNATSYELNAIDYVLRYRPEGYMFAPSYKKRYWDGWIRMFEKNKQIFQTGLLDRVIKQFNSKGIKYIVSDERKKPTGKVKISKKQRDNQKLEARTYQTEAINAFLKQHRGIINIPTGTGKTFCSIEIINKLKVRSLYVCPNTVIMHQVAEIFANVFGEKSVGIVYGKKKVINRNIVVACVSSLGLFEEEDFNKFDLLIIDEFHHCLSGGAKIKTNKGVLSIKNIVENKINCKVLTFNAKKEIWEYKQIINYFKYETPDELMEIKYLSNNIEKKLICTTNHKIYTKNRGYVEAQHLTTQDDVVIEKPYVCNICNKQHKTIHGLGGCMNGHKTPLEKKQKQAKKMLKHENWHTQKDMIERIKYFKDINFRCLYLTNYDLNNYNNELRNIIDRFVYG